MTIADPPTVGLQRRARDHMGRAVTCLEGVPGTRTAHEPSWWLCFMGRPEPDMNMALVHEDDPEALVAVVAHVVDAEVGALVMLAGEGERLAGRFPAGWDAAGSMPIMACDLDAVPLADDARSAGPGRPTRPPSRPSPRTPSGCRSRWSAR